MTFSMLFFQVLDSLWPPKHCKTRESAKMTNKPCFASPPQHSPPPPPFCILQLFALLMIQTEENRKQPRLHQPHLPQPHLDQLVYQSGWREGDTHTIIRQMSRHVVTKLRQDMTMPDTLLMRHEMPHKVMKCHDHRHDQFWLSLWKFQKKAHLLKLPSQRQDIFKAVPPPELRLFLDASHSEEGKVSNHVWRSRFRKQLLLCFLACLVK